MPSLPLPVLKRPRTIGYTIMGVLYGGMTEEILLRWGVLSLLAWGLWRLAGRPTAADRRPAAVVMWAAIIGAAVLFGVGHLPAVAALAPLTPILIARTIALNSVAGIIFGWLYWRHHLEAAMVAHATFHIVLTAIVWTTGSGV
ncbi:MAG: CPBP family intramembrane metalloprotease [Chloroflexaceae bacterium]|nr:CPBP family intramembrane metalloprotease [Chloroflexaceae bacterium]